MFQRLIDKGTFMNISSHLHLPHSATRLASMHCDQGPPQFPPFPALPSWPHTPVAAPAAASCHMPTKASDLDRIVPSAIQQTLHLRSELCTQQDPMLRSAPGFRACNDRCPLAHCRLKHAQACCPLPRKAPRLRAYLGKLPARLASDLDQSMPGCVARLWPVASVWHVRTWLVAAENHTL